MSDSKNDNKVVQFPTHKIKPVKVTGAELVEKNRKNQGWTVLASLVFTVFLTSYLSSQMNPQSQKIAQKVTERGLASEDGQVYTNTRTYEEDVFLAKKISKDSLRDPASVGRKPSSRDELTFVFLKIEARPNTINKLPPTHPIIILCSPTGPIRADPKREIIIYKRSLKLTPRAR